MTRSPRVLLRRVLPVLELRLSAEARQNRPVGRLVEEAMGALAGWVRPAVVRSVLEKKGGDRDFRP